MMHKNLELVYVEKRFHLMNLREIWCEINIKFIFASIFFAHHFRLSFSLSHRDPRILELLYEEARHNVLLGRYIMEPAHSIMLGGIQARIELGPYNVHTHTVSYFRWVTIPALHFLVFNEIFLKILFLQRESI